jgi:hypothetical protein
MRKLALLVGLLVFAPFAHAQIQVPIVSGVATIDAALSTNAQTSSFLIILNANVTDLEIVHPKTGQQITIIFQQDSTGGRTVAYASYISSGIPPTSTASAVTAQAFIYNNNSNTWSGLSGSAGGGTATQTVASGTSALGTSLVSSGTCATAVTAVATGATTGMNLVADFTVDPTTLTGYGVSVSGSLVVYKFITASQVNFKVCNNTGGSLTPSAATLQWRVLN